MPDKNNNYTRKSLREFINYSNSTYGSAEILFGKNDYSYNVINYPREIAKFANLFITDSTSKYNIVMPKDFPIEIFSDTILLKLFPKEWIIENMIINNKQIALFFDNSKNKFYLEKFNENKYKYQSCLSVTLSSLEKASRENRLGEIYTLYLEIYT